MISNLIVSLTSYPKRISTVSQTIESLLAQSCIPEKILLWLSVEEFPQKEKDLPLDLMQLVGERFQIEWCADNIRSFKKLIPALRRYPEALLVTADDDICYPEDWLGKLYDAYCAAPQMIHCHRAHRVKVRSGSVFPLNWKAIYGVKPAFCNLLTTGGGVLFPPHSLHADVCDEKIFSNLCPHHDDLWVWAMAILNSTRINVISKTPYSLNIIENTQEYGLWEMVNIKESEKQFKNVLKKYPHVLKKLERESFWAGIFSVECINTQLVIKLCGIRIKLKRKKLYK